MRKLIFVFTAFLSVGAGAADFKKGMASCAIKDGDLGRLECYDQLARAMNLDGPQVVQTSVSGTGKWDIRQSTNPLDDSKTVVLLLDSQGAKSKWGKTVSLIARCQSNSTELYITWNDYLGSNAEVTTRVGAETAKTQRWTLSTDKQASFYPGSPIGFLKSMLGKDRLVAQVTPYNESPVTAVFPTSGLDNAIKPLRETCNW